MNTAVIVTKTDPEVKIQAQQVAQELGISLSSLVNAYLRQVARTRRVDFSLDEPSEYLITAMKTAARDRRAGKASPVFKSGKDAVEWLEKQGI